MFRPVSFSPPFYRVAKKSTYVLRKGILSAGEEEMVTEMGRERSEEILESVKTGFIINTLVFVLGMPGSWNRDTPELERKE